MLAALCHMHNTPEAWIPEAVRLAGPSGPVLAVIETERIPASAQSHVRKRSAYGLC